MKSQSRNLVDKKVKERMRLLNKSPKHKFSPSRANYDRNWRQKPNFQLSPTQHDMSYPSGNYYGATFEQVPSGTQFRYIPSGSPDGSQHCYIQSGSPNGGHYRYIPSGSQYVQYR